MSKYIKTAVILGEQIDRYTGFCFVWFLKAVIISLEGMLKS